MFNFTVIIHFILAALSHLRTLNTVKITLPSDKDKPGSIHDAIRFFDVI